MTAARPARTAAAWRSTRTSTSWPSCARQATPDGRATLRERVAVEHSLAHVGRRQGRRARYCGTRANLFDLRRCAVVHNLHVIGRLPDAEAA